MWHFYETLWHSGLTIAVSTCQIPTARQQILQRKQQELRLITSLSGAVVVVTRTNKPGTSLAMIATSTVQVRMNKCFHTPEKRMCVSIRWRIDLTRTRGLLQQTDKHATSPLPENR